jgi:hypothetical protein
VGLTPCSLPACLAHSFLPACLPAACMAAWLPGWNPPPPHTPATTTRHPRTWCTCCCSCWVLVPGISRCRHVGASRVACNGEAGEAQAGVAAHRDARLSTSVTWCITCAAAGQQGRQ